MPKTALKQMVTSQYFDPSHSFEDEILNPLECTQDHSARDSDPQRNVMGQFIMTFL